MTEKQNSLITLVGDRKFQLKLKSLGLRNKYQLKDCLMMAPEAVLNKKSNLDTYALGIFLV